ncbi:MAG: hypothetical protein WD360_02110 [Nitriliruptoraceae bacterium]
MMLLSSGALLAMSPPAEAHTRTEETTNILSRITSAPLPAGVEVTVHTGGLLIEVENRTDTTLTVYGYGGEPYLRIGPSGVEHNRRSPATYLNASRYGDVAMPRDVDADAAPEWVHIDDEPRYLWHDHRTHWMSTTPPPFVDAGPIRHILMRTELVGTIGTAGLDQGSFQSWVLPLGYGEDRIEVAGELVWVDPPSGVLWLLLAAAGVAPALLGWRRRDLRALVRPAALVVLAVAVVNGIHLVDDLVAWPGDPLDEAFGLLHTTIFLVGGIGGSVWALTVTTGRVLALGIGSASVLYHQGLVHLPLLYASQFPTVWPDNLVRFTIALGLLQAIPVALTVLRARSERGFGDVAREPTLVAVTPQD